VSIGIDDLDSGVASVTTGALSPGSHTIVACFPGNAIFTSSGGSVEQVVGP
jgi:hypothetical protein